MGCVHPWPLANSLPLAVAAAAKPQPAQLGTGKRAPAAVYNYKV
jgi:hypothetical protein